MEKNMKLTKTTIERLRASDKDQFVWDSETRGFGVRISRGGVLSFVAQGHVVGSPGHARVRITIGPFGVFTIDQARDEARELLRQMRKGIDPRAARKAEEVVRTSLETVALAYVDRPGKLKQSSMDTILRHVRTTFGDWKDDPIVAITEDMCRKRYRRMLTGGLRGKKGAPGQANQGFAVLGALLAYAGRQFRRADGSPLCTRAPVDALKDDRVRLKPRTTRILDHKVGAVWVFLRDWRTTTFNRDTVSSIDLVRFLLLTGLRISEAAALTWDRVHLDDAWFSLPNPKNGNPVSFPLATQSVELLRQRPRVKGSPFVFPSWGEAGHIVDPRDVMKKVSKAAGSHITPHDLRRTWTNISLRCCRIEKFRTDLLSNHLTRDVTSEHYFDTTNLQWLAPEAQQIADWIEQQAVISEGKNVVQFPTAAAEVA
jgi:integrase